MVSVRSKLSSQDTSIFSIIAKLSNQHNAINLGQGFPDFEIDQKLKDLVKKVSEDSKNQYAPMPGIFSLRELLSEKYNLAYHTNLDPDLEITITAGATQAIFTTIQALVRQGDEVIIIEPAYDSYAPSIQLAGGMVVPYALDRNFKVDWNELKSLVSENTRMIIINNPHNPTGQVLEDEDYSALSQITQNTDILILSDEVYEHLVYDDKSHKSILGYPDLYHRSIAVYSFGKTFHATGWKMGYAIAPKKLTQEIRNVHQWNVFSVNSLMQNVLKEYLEEPSHYLNLAKFYQEKRDYFANGMDKSRFKSIPSHGSYFQLYDYAGISDLDDMAFAEWLIKEHGIACIPISPFYTNAPNNKVVRFCFAKKKETLSTALKKLIQV